MPTISEAEVKGHEVMVVPRYRSGKAYGSVSVGAHIRDKQYHVITRLRRRALPPGVPAHIRPIVERNQGHMRQVSQTDPQQTLILYRNKDFAKVVAWLNREFNLHLEAQA